MGARLSPQPGTRPHDGGFSAQMLQHTLKDLQEFSSADRLVAFSLTSDPARRWISKH